MSMLAVYFWFMEPHNLCAKFAGRIQEEHLYMKTILILTLTLFSLTSTAQLSPGFDKQEALDMIQLCNSFPFIESYNSDNEIIPHGYEKTYTSGVFGMDNMFQIYTSERGYAVINFRGSTDKKISWMENFYSAMIPSKGTIQIKDRTINYKFAEDTAAHVHAGYALGIAYMNDDLRFHIKYLNMLGIYDIMLTGHSQGGALCQLLLSYLNYLPEGTISSDNTFKVYSFAAPMVGNAGFVAEYDSLYTQTDMSHLIINEEDVVPALPLAYRDGPLLTEAAITSLFDKEQSFEFKDAAYNGFINLFENSIGSVNKWFSDKVGAQIGNDLGSFSIPPYTHDINYSRVGNVIALAPVEYPVHLKDSTILDDKERLAELEVGEDGLFTDKGLYETGNKFYQHKPYNYYIALLKAYFPALYEAKEPKYLVENL